MFESAIRRLPHLVWLRLLTVLVFAQEALQQQHSATRLMQRLKPNPAQGAALDQVDTLEARLARWEDLFRHKLPETWEPDWDFGEELAAAFLADLKALNDEVPRLREQSGSFVARFMQVHHVEAGRMILERLDFLVTEVSELLAILTDLNGELYG